MKPEDSRTLFEGKGFESSRAPQVQPDRPVPPLSAGRFRLGRLLGQGGMGRVYEAWDPHLSRHVAVKIMRGGEAKTLQRFRREALAQAALSHPAICPVYEVGEEDGVPFIVMQRFEGLPLHEAAEQLPMESTLNLMRQVAEAVHEAHRSGLIHRDLKPGNVLVEAPEGEPPRPYVLDFGLARPFGAELEGDALQAITEDGAFLGTPAYMSPEQLRGEVATLDHRSDIYSLGATLYLLLTGQPPFRFDKPIDVLNAVNLDPPRLTTAGVPAEVEHIVFKCLEKDPERRYASAAALAEDLRRYLDGETVLARPASATYRVGKWVRRHRRLTAALLALTLTLFGAIAWSLYADHRAKQRELLVSTFVEDVKEMEAQVRYSYMAPLHDIRPDRELLRQRMARIRSDMRRHDSRNAGAGHYALGSGHLALEEFERARDELEAAWQAQYRPRETSAALAQTLSALYREDLSDLEFVQDWDSRQQRLAALDERYGDPLRLYLSQRPPGDDEPLLTALDHFHRNRFDEAIETLRSSRSARPWSYEIPLLEGEIRRAWAIQRGFEDDREGADQELQLARAAYERAVAVAESHPAIHRALAQVAFQRLTLQAAEQKDPTELVTEGLAAAQRALEAHPKDARAWLWTARIHRTAAANEQVRSGDPESHLEMALAAAQRAAGGQVASVAAWRELARAHWGRARRIESRGDDPENSLHQAVATLERVPTEERDYYDEFLSAMIHQTRARHRLARGGDAGLEYRAAIDSYRAAIALHSRPINAWTNLGSCALALAASDGIDDPKRWLAEAETALRNAQDLSPANAIPLYYLGLTYLRLAQDGDPVSEKLAPHYAARAIDAYHQALDLAPSMFQVHIALGEIYHLQALQAVAVGDSPAADFHRAREAHQAGLSIAPSNATAQSNLAWTDYFEGKFLVRAGHDPGSFLQRAIEGSREAFEASGRPHALLALASSHRLVAEWRLTTNDGSVGAAIEDSRQTFQQLLTLDPGHAEAHRSLGRLATLEAQWRRQRGEDPQPALDTARGWIEKALALEPEGSAYWLALAQLEIEEASATARERGLQAVARALEIRPHWTRAEAVQRQLSQSGTTPPV